MGAWTGRGRLKPVDRRFLFWTIALFILGASIELTDQEAYYWTWSVRPALGYYEHPPLQAWLTHLLTTLFGDATWVVRLPATFGRIATYLLFGEWVRRRWNAPTAELAQSILLGTFFFCAGSFIALPDSLVLPLALLTMIYVEADRPIAAGLAWGFAGLAKWTSALMLPGIAATYLSRRKTRGSNVRGLVQTSLIALVLQTPVLIWNYQNGWASFLFHLGRRHKRTVALTFHELVANLAAFGFSQIVLGGFGLLMAFIAWRRVRAKGAFVTSNYPSLAWWTVPPFLVFGLSAARGELRFYWTLLAFPPIMAYLASDLTKLSRSLGDARRFEKRIWVATFVMHACVFAALLLPVGDYARPLTDLYKSYDLRHSPRGDLKGWEEWIDEDIRPLGYLERKDVAFLGADFHLAAQVAWTGRIKDLERVGTVKGQFQFKFWERPHPEEYPTVVFFSDNRIRMGKRFRGFCKQKVRWRKKPILLQGRLIKTITWGVCETYKLHPNRTKSWRFDD